jgi:hypothetical protein
VCHLLNNHSLPIIGSLHKEEVCEPCQLGKSKQLPFHASPTESFNPHKTLVENQFSGRIKNLQSGGGELV